MNCTRAREHLPELLDARTGPAELPEVRAHLAVCADCQREAEALRVTLSGLDALPVPAPSPRLRRDFYALLAAERAGGPASVPAPRPSPPRRAAWRWLLYPVAGCALLALGFLAGQRTPPVPGGAAAERGTQQELAALREQMGQQRDQLAKMTTLVTYSLLQQQQHPANERLQQLLAQARQEQPSERTLDTLISALTLDPSVNIRLRAIEALYPHAERELVRSGVLAALPREQHPLVQLELIEFIALTQDRSAAPVLERVSA
ncbi:MAG: zf-HC2 domain-containing protein, partial [Opitutaceae bacterium]|nr:zf-HC2 domain-containing protein [Opitutaceae bacterium]